MVNVAYLPTDPVPGHRGPGVLSVRPSSPRASLRPRAEPAKREELMTILENYELPTFPTVAMVALQKLRDPDIALTEVAERLAADPGISSHLLSVTNSAAYGLRHEIENVEHAVSLLGRNELESLLLATSVRAALPHRPRPGFAPARFWKAAGRRAAAAKALASILHPETKSESFTAALLQDMAVPVLSAALMRRYGMVLASSQLDGADLAQRELTEFGWTHADAAGFMCKRWSFPKRITLAVERHHYTDLSAVGVLPAVSLVSRMGESDDGSDIEQMIEAVRDFAGTPKEVTREILDNAVASAEEMARMFVVR